MSSGQGSGLSTPTLFPTASFSANRTIRWLLDRDAAFRDRVAEGVELGVAFDLVGDVVGARIFGGGEDHAVAIPFVPCLVVGRPAAVAMGFDEPDDVGVMVAGLFDVGYPNRDMSDAHHRHDSALRGSRCLDGNTRAARMSLVIMCALFAALVHPIYGHPGAGDGRRPLSARLSRGGAKNDVGRSPACRNHGHRSYPLPGRAVLHADSR